MIPIRLHCVLDSFRSLTFPLFLLFALNIAIGQVSGNVTDTDGTTLPGVTLIVLGTEISSQTDFNGDFVIEANIGDTLLVSYNGYESKSIKIVNLDSIQIELEINIKVLDEIVVVGYGSKSKSKLTSAISTVDVKTIIQQPVPNVSNALEGLASGLFVQQFSGEPGFSSSSFEIRNFGSALVIVDGAPGDINQLDPNEIDNISVLKDAAASAIYGVQGGNGVILVTTRKGLVGKPKLSYSDQYTYTSFTSYPEFLSSSERAEILNEGLRNSGLTEFYNQSEIDLFKSGDDPINYPNTDWRNLVFKEWGLQQQKNLNLSGGNDNTTYFVSAGFIDQGSNYKVDVLSFQRFNFRTNLSTYISDDLKFDFNFGGRRQVRKAPGYSAYDIFRELSRSLPSDLAYYPDGTPFRPSTTPNHVFEGLKDYNAGYYHARNNNFDAKISLDWYIRSIKGLKLRSYGSIIYDTSFNKDWDKSFDLYTLNRITGNFDSFQSSPPGSPSDTRLSLSTNYSNHYVFQQSINYDRKFAEHNISLLALAEVQKIQGQDFSASRQDFQSTLIDQLYAGSLQNQLANGGEFRENRIGYIGRLNYDYKSKYFIESAVRYDGSSRFAPGNQFGLFPSISLGWRLSEESFFRGLKGFVPNMKLRASYGSAGYDGTAAYQWLSGFNYDLFFVINDTAIPNLNNTALPNRNISWETINTYDLGLDMNLFNNDLNISFDYFFRNRLDVIAGANASIPNTLGVSLAAQNLYEFSNEGFDFSVDYKKEVSQNLKFITAFKFSKARERAVFIDEELQVDPFMRANLTQTGGFTGLRRGYISDGLFQNQEEIDQWADQDGNNNLSIQPGDIKYKDLNGDSIIDIKDQKVFGSGSKPFINYSLNLGFEYRRFTVSSLLTGAAGYEIYLDGEAQSPLRNGFNGYDYQLDYWTPNNPNASFPRITNGGFNENNYRYSNFWSRDGKHLRLRNVNLGYTLPLKNRDSGLKEVRFFFTGQNLFVLKSFKENFDPQMNSGTGWYYPQTKSITFGLNVSL